MTDKLGSRAEQALLDEITHWQECFDELENSRTHSQQSMRRLYRELITCRQKLLAATRDGCPENWSSYVVERRRFSRV